MKKNILIVAFSLIAFSLFSQSTLPRFNGWVDNENYILEKKNEKGESSQIKANAKSGKEANYDVAPAVSFTSMMPEGFSAPRRGSHISSDKTSIVFSQDNNLYFFSKTDKKMRQLTANLSKENNPRFSPDGKRVAFTRNHNLFVIELETGLEKQLTTDGSDLIYNGWASWVYYEEILGRGSNYRAFYWSPNSEQIAFMHFDDTDVPNFPIYHHEGEDMSHGYLEMTSYPKSGDPNPIVELGVYNLNNNTITWAKKNKDLEYLAMIQWSPDGDRLLFQQLSRDQDILEMYKMDLVNGNIQKVYEEQQKTWIDWFNDIYFLEKSDGIIVRSNRDGWFNLYHYNWKGKLVNQITKNNFRTNSISKIDEGNQKVYYNATGENSVEMHLFAVNMNGKNQKQLTKKAGWHRTTVSPSGDYFMDQFSSFNNPGEMRLFNTNGKEIKEIGKSTKDINQEKGFTVEFFTVPSTDGFDLPAYWVLPPNFDKNKKYPVIFDIYGGPDAGGVYNRFRNYTWNPIYEEGVIRFTVDHRGSGKFGKKGLDYLHRSLGEWEIHDYIEAVKWLEEKSFVDGDKIGIQGSSYGGYMAGMALTLGADYFNCGIAALSVTDWRLYDNVYTERYMDEPKNNKEGYDYGSVLTHASKLKGKLLITHGAIDDNVHMQNSMQLISKLQDEGMEFELMIYPGNRHGIRGAKGRHNQQLGLKFWRKSFDLKVEKP
ncbi:MAG: DPP IV N-terminal domain-containing protein [Saprospiraceae bacterium]